MFYFEWMYKLSQLTHIWLGEQMQYFIIYIHVPKSAKQILKAVNLTAFTAHCDFITAYLTIFLEPVS